MRHYDEGRPGPGGAAVNTPVADFVRAYAGSGVSRLHMPGHKGQPFLGCEALDITEVQGADALFEAEGILRESEEHAASLFGAARTLYSTEGSSLCIRAMLCLALTCRPAGTDRLLCLRRCPVRFAGPVALAPGGWEPLLLPRDRGGAGPGPLFPAPAPSSGVRHQP